ncbi:MAG: efflux RND transporter periplasmic adaptor subunit [Terriglobales bacterium]|jgi:RND family efflux transporter MFP subunit
MPIESSGLTPSIVTLYTRLLEKQEVIPRARILAQTVADLFPGSAVNVYSVSTLPDGDVWMVLANIGEVSVEPSIPLETGTLGLLAQELKPLRFEGKTLVREEFAHLHVRRTLRSLSYVPLKREGELNGAIEILTFDGDVSESHLDELQAVAEVAGGALYSAQLYEDERQNTLHSITRLTQLYDIEKVFSSTLEFDKLLPIIGSKVLAMLECEAVNVWLLEPDESLRLMHQAGLDPTVLEQSLQRPKEGVAGDVSDDGEPVLIQFPDDPRLVRRNQGIEGSGVVSLIAAAILDQEWLVGVIEAVNKLGDEPFDDDDLFTLSRLTESAGIALHNASLLAAERKVEVLETLVRVSHEITSTLDLDRVLQAVVNGPASVIPYERAAIALDQRGRVQLRAVSGTLEFNPEDPQIVELSQVLQWASLLQQPEFITQRGEEISSEREATQAKFRHYFSQSGMRGFHAVPLADDEGRVGVLSFESSDPDFLTSAHLEMIKVLASQATVALRNASLYKEVPFIGVLQPLVEQKRKFLALEKHRRITITVAAVAAVLFLALFPLPLRVDGPARVAPGRSARIGVDVDGIVKQVNVREGDPVRKGTVIASLEDWDYRSALAAAQAKRETAVALMNRALAANDDTEAGIQQAQADYWTTEVARAQQRLDRTLVRSPIDGVVATPHIENLVGQKLKFGDPFADIVDNSQALVDVSVDQTDIALVAAGQKARIKLDGFPARTFEGAVVVVSPLARLDGDSRTFSARVAVPNPDSVLRAGMQGRGKVSTGWRPAGQVFFRQPIMWIWSKLWDWFGW